LYKLIPNFSLKQNNSFGLDVRSDYWLSLSGSEDWNAAIARYPHLLEEKKMIIGGGTNLLFLSDFDGLIISPDFCGYSIAYQDSQVVEISVGAGVEWDDFVAYCVGNGWYGAENLSLIPGKVGAAAVQNIGAYGIEAATLITKVDGYNMETSRMESFSADQCRFGYRSSIFKEKMSNTFMVTSVTFTLKKDGAIDDGYGDLKRMIAEFGEPTLQNMRKAVMQIRESKLPDPHKIGNAGSFFKNPVVAEAVAKALKERLPGLPVYQMSEGFVKIGAGFLIEKAGWKGYQMGCAAVHDRQALVLINRGGATGQEILDLSQAIQQDVLNKFSIMLEREVEVVGG
jgi:UDP-N-acetylmuramate dehydrogenase